MKLSPNTGVFKEFKITLHEVILKKMMSVRNQYAVQRFELYEIFTEDIKAKK